MLHLPADRLAELVDVEPTSQELAHLQSCAACARERKAFRALREVAAAARDCTVEPLLEWENLRPALAAEGLLVRTAERPAIVPGTYAPRFSARQWSLRVAASIALLVGGAALGRATAPDEASLQTARGESPPSPPAIVQEGVPTFATATEAMTALVRAQQDYQRAAAFLLASDTTAGPASPTMYKQRLAALDELMGVTRSALTRSPQDPVINSYYLAALGAREATLQQLELTLPEGTKIDRF